MPAGWRINRCHPPRVFKSGDEHEWLYAVEVCCDRHATANMPTSISVTIPLSSWPITVRIARIVLALKA
jgi:hypothetical protein